MTSSNQYRSSNRSRSTITVVMDNQAITTLRAGSNDPRGRWVASHLDALNTTLRRNRQVELRLVVPTAVRVEAGWARDDPASGSVNRLGISDSDLDRRAADTAARIMADTGCSVAAAHVGAVAQHSPDGDVYVVTSDPDDITIVCGDRSVRLLLM